jgi:hypothetical protein
MQTLERYLEALRTQDWESLASCLAEDVQRSGPYLDVVRGKQPYLGFLSKILPSLRNYQLKVSRVRNLEGGSALVELVEALDVDGVRKEFSEALLFDFDEEGLIRRVDVYMKQPPPVGRSQSGS